MSRRKFCESFEKFRSSVVQAPSPQKPVRSVFEAGDLWTSDPSSPDRIATFNGSSGEFQSPLMPRAQNYKGPFPFFFSEIRFLGHREQLHVQLINSLALRGHAFDEDVALKAFAELTQFEADLVELFFRHRDSHRTEFAVFR